MLNGIRTESCVLNQIEHAQHLAPGAAKRFGKHGIIASVQVMYLLPLLYLVYPL
jgi:predicted amidohydrolase YtcJ